MLIRRLATLAGLCAALLILRSGIGGQIIVGPGTAGPVGVTGRTGATGSTGATGANGTTFASGTPQYLPEYVDAGGALDLQNSPIFDTQTTGLVVGATGDVTGGQNPAFAAVGPSGGVGLAGINSVNGGAGIIAINTQTFTPALIATDVSDGGVAAAFFGALDLQPMPQPIWLAGQQGVFYFDVDAGVPEYNNGNAFVPFVPSGRCTLNGGLPATCAITITAGANCIAVSDYTNVGCPVQAVNTSGTTLNVIATAGCSNDVIALCDR